jgi:hypothetical protein
MNDPCAQLISKRRCRVSSLLMSDMLTFVEELFGICEIAAPDCLDWVTFNVFVLYSLKIKRFNPLPMQGSPRLWHLEQIGWIWSHCDPMRGLRKAVSTVYTSSYIPSFDIFDTHRTRDWRGFRASQKNS